MNTTTTTTKSKPLIIGVLNLMGESGFGESYLSFTENSWGQTGMGSEPW